MIHLLINPSFDDIYMILPLIRCTFYFAMKTLPALGEFAAGSKIPTCGRSGRQCTFGTPTQRPENLRPGHVVFANATG